VALLAATISTAASAQVFGNFMEDDLEGMGTGLFLVLVASVIAAVASLIGLAVKRVVD
jgi:hypothetical protein